MTGSPVRAFRRGTIGELVMVNPHSWDPREGGDIQYLDIASVVAPGRLTPPRPIEAQSAPSRARRRAKEGDVLVSTVRPYLRAFARVGRAPENLVVSTGFAVLRPKIESDSGFVYQHILTRRFIDYLQPRMTGSGYPAVRPEDVADYPILVPPPLERERVAAILDSIDAAIERTEEVTAATDALRRALLQDLLTRGVPGWHKEWKHFPGIGTTPADWEVVKLGELLSSADYGTNAILTDEPKGVPILRMGNLQDGEIVWDGLRWADLSNQEQSVLGLESGDILFNRTNSIDLVGKVAIVRDLPQKASFASYLIRLRTKQEKAEVYWLNSYLNLPATQARLRRMATKGASQANINPTNLQSLLIPWPSRNEQAEIAGCANGLYELAEVETGYLALLGTVQAAVADALLSGRVRVALEKEAARG